MKSGISVRWLISTTKKKEKKAQAGNDWSNILPISSQTRENPPRQTVINHDDQNIQNWHPHYNDDVSETTWQQQRTLYPISIQTRVGCSSLIEHRTVTPLTQFRFPGAARDFSPRVNFQCRLSYSVCTPPCVIACIYTCAHIKDPIVQVRVRWIMETLKHPAYTLGWVAQLCRSWLSSGKASWISQGRNPTGTIHTVV